jgi:hypothetical protein
MPVVVTTKTKATRWTASTTKRHQLAGVLSICDPVGCRNYKRPFGIRALGHKAMLLSFEDDVFEDNLHPNAPTRSDVDQILAFGRQHHDAFSGREDTGVVLASRASREALLPRSYVSRKRSVQVGSAKLSNWQDRP